LRHNISRKYHVFHSIFEGHTTSPTAGSHHSATDIAPLEGADQPGPIDPAAFQQRPGLRIVDNAAMSREEAPLSRCDDIAHGVTRFWSGMVSRPRQGRRGATGASAERRGRGDAACSRDESRRTFTGETAQKDGTRAQDDA
jgi:hypothetical protein